jgi:hypothetical protein
MTDKHGTNEPENQYPHIERRVNYPCSDHDKRLTMAEKAVSSVEKVMEAVSTKLDLILAQITKVAILEEKHSNLIVDNDRAHKKIAALEKKHDDLAVEIREFMNFSKGQGKVMWAIGAAVSALVIKALFFAANHGMTP